MRSDVIWRFIVPGIAGLALAIFAGTMFHSRMEDPDGYLSPKMAETIGLISEKEAPWSGKIPFKRAKNGGFDYQKIATSMFVSFAGDIKHTSIDIEKECQRLGQCMVFIK